MTETTPLPSSPDTTAFERLRTLVKRGYQPDFASDRRQPGFVGIDLVHAKKAAKDAPPKLTLWSDGTVATSSVLWPKQYVPSDDGPPDWQRVIFCNETERFDSFAKSVPLPSLKDLYVSPSVFESKVFAARLIFGFTLCILVASACRLGGHFV